MSKAKVTGTIERPNMCTTADVSRELCATLVDPPAALAICSLVCGLLPLTQAPKHHVEPPIPLPVHLNDTSRLSNQDFFHELSLKATLVGGEHLEHEVGYILWVIVIHVLYGGVLRVMPPQCNCVILVPVPPCSVGLPQVHRGDSFVFAYLALNFIGHIHLSACTWLI